MPLIDKNDELVDKIDELAAALVAAQGEFPNIAKTEVGKIKGVNKGGAAYEYSYKYAPLPEVVEAVKPILLAHGLAVSQFLSFDGEHDTLTTWLLHKSGQYIHDTMRLHLAKDDPQGQGSAVTYARRYSYMAVLGLVADEDDDGNAATKAKASNVIKAASRDRARVLLAEHTRNGESAVDIIQALIGKEKPETEADMQKLIKALEDED